MRRAVVWFLLLAVAAVAGIELRAWFDRHPQDLPWTELDLDDPVGRFTASKLAALGSDPARCRILLGEAGSPDQPAPPRTLGTECGYVDGMRLRRGAARTIGFAPPGLVTSCPVAGALLLWDERVVQPAARVPRDEVNAPTTVADHRLSERGAARQCEHPAHSCRARKVAP